nr:hypothetical protein [Tanacetum cinerariifolium]
MNDKMNDPECVTRKDNFEGIQKALTKEVKEMKDVFEELEAEVAQYAVDRKHDAIKLKNLLIANDNLIDECLSQEVFCVATNSELNVARFTEMHVANTTAETCLKLRSTLKSLRDKHAIDIEPIVPCLRNNRDAHLDYLRHLKESVETIRDIVEEAKVVRPRDRSIVSACRYTKHSHELLEYATGTCPQGSQQRAKQLAHIPLIRKKQVTVTKPSDKSDSTTHRHVVTVKSQKTNVPVPPSTGVNSCPNASGSQPKSHVKANRISPAKGPLQLPPPYPQYTSNSFVIRSYVTRKLDATSVGSNWEKQLLSGSRKITKQPNLQDRDGSPEDTNFFRAFTASSTIPSIYIQQFCDTILCDKKAGCYKCQLDEQWFDLTNETLREALQITLVNHNQAFAAPPSIDGLINFVNQLGYPKKTSGFERPGAPVLQILWVIVTRTNIDYAERIWEEFTQSIHIFIEDKQNRSWHTSRKKRATLIVIPSIRFTKLIIHHLQRKHRFHPRLDSPLHLSNEESVLGYLKFSAKGTKSEVADEDTDYQKALEKSMKDTYALPKGPLPPVVIREPESGKYQPLPEVPGKGKAKVTEEQHKKTSPANQYIFQRRVFEPTGSSRHDESPYALLGQSDNEEESKNVVLRAEEGGQDEGQAGSNPNETSDGQAGSNPDETSKGQAGPDPGDAEAKVQSILSHVVHAGSDHEHMDLDVADVSPQPSTEQLDEGFTATVYPNVQENLKLAIEEPVLLEEPASSSGTLSSLQHLSRDFSFGDQFFSDKHSDADKNAETEVESMMNVTIQQALSSISLMTSPIIDLTSRPRVSPGTSAT